MSASVHNKLRVLVTGSSGFVGRSLCSELMRQGHFVRGVRRRSSATISGDQINDCFVIEDLGPETDWADSLADIDVVVHLAARVHQLNDSSENPLQDYRRINTQGTVHLARSAAKAGVKRFIFLSSIKVSGESTTAEKGFVETDPAQPMDPYGISKHEAELALNELQASTDMQIVILRPPLVYGPGVKANFLKLFSLVNRGLPLPLGCVDNRRSFIYIGNLVDILCRCLLEPKAVGNTYLLADVVLSTPELIREIAAALGKRPYLLPVPLWLLRTALTVIGKRPVYDRLTGSLRVNTAKLQAELDWSPVYSLQEGLRTTAEWYLSAQAQKD